MAHILCIFRVVDLFKPQKKSLKSKAIGFENLHF